MMRILLVWPDVNNDEMNNFLPLGLGYLAANIRKHYEVELWDGIIDKASNLSLLNKVSAYQPNIIGISVWSFNFIEVKKIVALLKKNFHNTMIVIGGPAVSCSREKILQVIEADYAISGEGDLVFPELIELYLNEEIIEERLKSISGLIYRNVSGDICCNEPKWICLDKIQYCSYKILNIEKYWEKGYRYGIHRSATRIAPIQVTRGCPYPCEFCSARRISGNKVRVRPVKSVINEIKELYFCYGADGINIIDDNFTYNLEYAKKICREIIKLNLQNFSICCPNGIKMERLDAELLELMKTAGWSCIYIAPESGSDKTLKNMKKQVDLRIVDSKIELIKKAGLMVLGYFIIGYPGETVRDIKKTIEFACRQDFDFAVFTCFQPIPGTPIFEKLKRNGEINTSVDGVDFCDVVYAPESLTVLGMKILRLWAIVRFYLTSYKRFRNVMTYFSIYRILKFIIKIV